MQHAFFIAPLFILAWVIPSLYACEMQLIDYMGAAFFLVYVSYVFFLPLDAPVVGRVRWRKQRDPRAP